MTGPAASVFPALMRIRAGCLPDLATEMAAVGWLPRRLLIVTGAGPSARMAAVARESLAGRGTTSATETVTEGTVEECSRLAQRLIAEDVELVVAIGGGRVLDTAKYAACRVGVDWVAVPTTLANDGVVSPVASLVDRDGVRRSLAATMPIGVLVDVALIADAPVATRRAGVGDLLSNLSAVTDWRLSEAGGHDRCDEFSALIAEQAAESVLTTADLESPRALAGLARGLIMSGLAMAIAGSSRPCSGSEHLISHALDQRLDVPKNAHGLQVAFASLLTLTLQGELTDELLTTYVRLGLPTAPSALGLTGEQLLRALDEAPSTRPGRWTVLSGRSWTAPALADLMSTVHARLAEVRLATV
ncbi:glycerol-1-phosphate dehydrogenase [NAD(P)+] [Blastococcus colisei]|uniref:Glycerol-1-phosphate dehydrogenase [NAD(P)+] n=1 Tax=Blastococcus colisei TaxID=1564162 RepID=A0A543PBT9_9ACTN|nr:iron-containing alcohol dehydrogenase family protein [Blastococcus colisei]TQN41480.1 glycerol-1-phosphate dehydrogenase [NAD(P)+] [Blastococcus colisei]